MYVYLQTIIKTLTKSVLQIILINYKHCDYRIFPIKRPRGRYILQRGGV